ncbi:hypothetical protein N9230_02795 [Akkermansiaceae bacterium]|nr:hypothetical protein [Akkermansiaceae bacterium]
MPGNPEGLIILKNYSEGLHLDFEYESDVTEQTLQIENGLLFLMAFWSGPSVVGFRNVCERLNRLALPEGFQFRVLDIDGASEILNNLAEYDVVIGGNAEGYWFKNGKIIASTVCQTGTPERITEIVDEIYDR